MDGEAHELVERLGQEYVNDPNATDDQILLATILIVLNDIARTMERIERK